MNYDYYQSDEWAEKREDALEDAGGECQRCNATEHLHVHHKYGLNSNRLVVLCEDCHSAIHSRNVRLPRDPPQCKECGERIEWKSSNSRWIPLNPDTGKRHFCQYWVRLLCQARER